MDWEEFEQELRAFDVQHVQGKGKFAFAFVEGPLVKALRSGDWYVSTIFILTHLSFNTSVRILLDEINLASAETLECISSLLQSDTSSITLTEQGSLEPVPRHPDFRIFACMNPATDVGKKDLPANLRSRFMEIDVQSPDADRDTLLSIIEKYIGHCTVGDKGAIMDVADFYTAVKKLSDQRKIADGENRRPHYSMRTLARSLMWASDATNSFGLRRALWEGCLMAFTMTLDSSSAEVLTVLARKHILANVKNLGSLLARQPVPPPGTDNFIKIGPFYLARGPLPSDPAEEHIITPSVERKLVGLARIIASRRFPVLIEGPTSTGKTSSIEYLAKRTGHRFVRINNHEHTDIQEYLGTYVSDPTTGKLIFQDGLLVRALRRGEWIVLDELNLAPTDVLEALNRLLDDNRELVIPETQEVVRPHPGFLLFATQNPPGLYGGRKVLSRAFRNRFLEVYFDDLPQAELETILCQRCRIAPSYAQRIVRVFQELAKRRQSTRVFESKRGFATLRDLFRWAGRDALGYQRLAENGYMLLAERARRAEDKAVVKEVIETELNVRIDVDKLYGLHLSDAEFSELLGRDLPTTHIIWTSSMRRLYTLVSRALQSNEPVLLVGETGCGKTSVCQMYADAESRTLYSVNCHQNTETADLIGALRPVRNRAALEAEASQEATGILTDLGVDHIPNDTQAIQKAIASAQKLVTLAPASAQALQDILLKFRRLSAMFEWHDGPLIHAMTVGGVFLLDEISLADDSVLERLNSVLEPNRTIVLAERGGESADTASIGGADGFQIVATMNPGGDYGKKELSPAMRNRFTEIWVPSIDQRTDLETIADGSWKHDELRPFTHPLLDFVEWLAVQASDRSLIALRDILVRPSPRRLLIVCLIC
jgi:midasin